MKVILLMLTCALCNSTSSSFIEATPSTKVRTLKPTMVNDGKVSIAFTGTVKAIEMLRERKLKVISVDIHPMFVVIVHIESVTPQETPLKEDAEVAFAIHSPSRLFLAEEKDVIGKKYQFKLTWEKVSNKSRFSKLSARLIEDNEARRK